MPTDQSFSSFLGHFKIRPPRSATRMPSHVVSPRLARALPLQPDGTWSTAVVPCEPRVISSVIAVSGAAGPSSLPSETDILARLQDELRQQVLDFSQKQGVRDLGRVRIASKAVHEAMMGTDLDLIWLEPKPSVAQLMSLSPGTALHKFKQMEQQCSCAASRALSHVAVGGAVSAHGWEAIPDHERLAVGVGRSWRVKSLDLDGVMPEQWRGLRGGLNLGSTVNRLQLEFSAVFEVSSDPSSISSLTQLTFLRLEQSRGDLTFVQNLSRLRVLDVSKV